MSDKEKRKDFHKWQVDLVVIAQDNCCLKCGNTLKKGFHRHHKDKNHANNKTDNLQLHCAECHRAEKGDALKEHRKQEKKILEDLNNLLDKGFEGKLSGANMERMLEAMGMSLKVSRSVNEMDVGVEYPSASLTLGTRIKEIETMTEYYLKGLHEGISLGAKAVKEE